MSSGIDTRTVTVILIVIVYAPSHMKRFPRKKPNPRNKCFA